MMMCFAHSHIVHAIKAPYSKNQLIAHYPVRAALRICGQSDSIKRSFVRSHAKALKHCRCSYRLNAEAQRESAELHSEDEKRRVPRTAERVNAVRRGPEVKRNDEDEANDDDDTRYMLMALEEAIAAAREGEVPVGAVIVIDGNVVSRAHNRVEAEQDPTAHAEMICIRHAAAQANAWRLSSATLYVTLEPCVMCAGALLQARVGRLVWGAKNTLLGADGSWIRVFPKLENISDSSLGTSQIVGPIHPFHPNVKITRGVLEAECSKVMRDFFRSRRKEVRSNAEEETRSETVRYAGGRKGRESILHYFLKKWRSLFYNV